MPTRERPLAAMAAAAGASICLGASVVATRFVIDQIEPATLAFLRYAIGTVCILVLLKLSGQRGVARRDMAPVAMLGVLFFGVFPWLFGASLRYIPAAHGAVILATMPILTLILARLRGFERLRPAKSAGVVATFVGVSLALLVGRGTGALDGNAWIGIGLMAVTALLGAIYSTFSRPYLQRNPSLGVAFASMLAGTVALVPIAAIESAGSGLPDLSAAGVWAVLFLGTFGGAIAFSLWIWALEHATPTRVTVFLTLNPMTATLLAAALLGEEITLAFLAGLALVVGGTLVVNWPDRRRPAAPSGRDTTSIS